MLQNLPGRVLLNNPPPYRITNRLKRKNGNPPASRFSEENFRRPAVIDKPQHTFRKQTPKRFKKIKNIENHRLVPLPPVVNTERLPITTDRPPIKPTASTTKPSRLQLSKPRPPMKRKPPMFSIGIPPEQTRNQQRQRTHQRIRQRLNKQRIRQENKPKRQIKPVDGKPIENNSGNRLTIPTDNHQEPMHKNKRLRNKGLRNKKYRKRPSSEKPKLVGFKNPEKKVEFRPSNKKTTTKKPKYNDYYNYDYEQNDDNKSFGFFSKGQSPFDDLDDE